MPIFTSPVVFKLSRSPSSFEIASSEAHGCWVVEIPVAPALVLRVDISRATVLILHGELPVALFLFGFELLESLLLLDIFNNVVDELYALLFWEHSDALEAVLPCDGLRGLAEPAERVAAREKSFVVGVGGRERGERAVIELSCIEVFFLREVVVGDA